MSRQADPRPDRRRRNGVRALLAAGAGCLLPGFVRAQDGFPNRPIRVVVPFAAGGTIDWIARSVSEALGKRLGQQVFIDNRPGANGLIGTELVARSPGDGHTLLLVTGSFAVNPSLYKTIRYDAVRDFTPITAYAKGTGMLVLVHPSVPAQTVRELTALRDRPGGDLNYGSPGTGNTIHLVTELFRQRTGVRLTHIPYKGSAPAVNALLANEVQMMILPPPLALPFVRGGKLRAIAFTGDRRLPDLPDVPTLKEAGVSDDGLGGSWIGLFAPSSTPDPIVERIYGELRTILAEPDTQAGFLEKAPGYLPDGRAPADFAAQVRADIGHYADILRQAGIQPE